MCVPCAKEIINEGATSAAYLANSMRSLIVGKAKEESRPLSEEEEAVLLDLARCEVSFIKAVRRAQTDMIKAQGGSPEWVALSASME